MGVEGAQTFCSCNAPFGRMQFRHPAAFMHLCMDPDAVQTCCLIMLSIATAKAVTTYLMWVIKQETTAGTAHKPNTSKATCHCLPQGAARTCISSLHKHQQAYNADRLDFVSDLILALYQSSESATSHIAGRDTAVSISQAFEHTSAASLTDPASCMQKL